MSRRTWILLACLALAVVLGVLGAVVTVPYVALGPGPTFNTLGTVEGTKVVEIDGERVYPAPGHLNLTTVSVLDGITVFGALGYWVSSERALVPRDEIFPPQYSEQQIERRNSRLFTRSESTATLAALRYLGYATTAVVQSVKPEAPAQGELTKGDEIIAVRGQPVESAQDLVGLLENSRPGDVVQLRVDRNAARPQTVDIVLGPGPEQHGYLGIVVTTRADVDFDVTINLAEVGGPSAGLMFALGIVDKLGPQSLTGGRFVAGTGTITPNGQVGPIGGIRFKMARASEAGADVFLVPAKNCEEALPTAPEGLRLIRVASLADAVNALKALRAGREPAGCG